jgi:hypothetical protein
LFFVVTSWLQSKSLDFLSFHYAIYFCLLFLSRESDACSTIVVCWDGTCRVFFGDFFLPPRADGGVTDHFGGLPLFLPSCD